MKVVPEERGTERTMKSRRVDYKKYSTLYHSIRFLFECGYKLKANPITIAIAATLTHRFVKEFQSGYDKYLIAATSLLIAGKFKDEPYKLRDVLNVAHQTLHRGSTPLDFREEYMMRRDAFVSCELLMMRAIKFQLSMKTPHKYLLHYLATLKTWINSSDWDTVPLCKTSMAFLQDFHHDPAILEFPPEHIAIGCINLAMQCYGIAIPCLEETEDKDWYSYLCKDAKKEDIWNVMEAIMDILNKEISSNDHFN